MTLLQNSTLQESDMLRPVLRLFPKRSYRRLHQVHMGRKRVDLVCVSRPFRRAERVIAVELKIRDWRTALWQAYINRQLAHNSYMAIWHEYAHRVVREQALLEHHDVGLIVVYPKSAKLVISTRSSGGQARNELRCRLQGITANDV